MKQSEHFDSFYPEFKKKSKKIMKDYTLPTSTLLKQTKQCRNNRRLKNNLTFFLSKFYQRCKKGVKNKIKN